jgi:hypothetical protein
MNHNTDKVAPVQQAERLITIQVEKPIPLPLILDEPMEYRQEPKPLASIPLSQLYSNTDELCPVCGIKMSPESPGLTVRNPEGYIVCRSCVNKRIGE